MAANYCHVNAPAVALTAATAKTVWSVLAAANVCLRVKQLKVTLDGADATKAPAKVEICYWDAAGAGTKSDITAVKRDPARAETPQFTAQHTYTAEPTNLTVRETVYVPQFNGSYGEVMPLTMDLIVPGGDGLAVRVTSPDAVNCTVTAVVEE